MPLVGVTAYRLSIISLAEESISVIFGFLVNQRLRAQRQY